MENYEGNGSCAKVKRLRLSESRKECLGKKEDSSSWGKLGLVSPQHEVLRR